MSHTTRWLLSQIARASRRPPPKSILCQSLIIDSTPGALVGRSRAVFGTACVRIFSTTRQRRQEATPRQKAKELNQKGLDEHEQAVKAREHQVRRPWLRDGADEPPVSPDGGEKVRPMTKGKLLTTPTRLLKLVLPLPVAVERDTDNNSRDYGRAISANEEIQPLALLVHPQQPLSYLERLIQAELPPVLENGKEKLPNVYFRAEDTSASSLGSGKYGGEKPKSPHVASYSGLGHEAPLSQDGEANDKHWVRWSSSTEVGDFIRDAARGREFAIEVEGYNVEMRVGVPSFGDRTYYLRLRLRRLSRRVDELSRIKRECDAEAHRAARRLAKGGFVGLAGWWGAVYYLTFHTEFGWDMVEPVTYLAGLGTIMGGYLWFLFISRDLSYKAAMNITVSRRQGALYEARRFDPQKWEQLLDEANALRREIRAVAVEYDVDWDEARDLGGEEVKEVLEKARKHKLKDVDEDEEDEDFDKKGKKEKEDKKDDDETKESRAKEDKDDHEKN